MLKKHSEFFKNLLFLFDIVLISVCWVFAYYLRFHSGLIPLYYGELTPFEPYLYFIVPVIIIWGLMFRAFDLYRPRRISGRFEEFLDIFKACTLSLVILIAVAYFFKQFGYSRLVFLIFWSTSIVALTVSRAVFREGLRFLRRKGYNLRHVLIVGDGKLAREIIKKITVHPELGLSIIGLLGGEAARVGRAVHGKKIIGTYDDIEKVVSENTVDQLFMALPFSEIKLLESIMERVGDHPFTIKVIPDIFHFLPFCGNVEEFEGMAFLTLQGSPLYGWNMVVKRTVDIVIASLALVLTLPLMAVISLFIKLTSSGPVLFQQKRATMDGKVFNILKFRTMTVCEDGVEIAQAVRRDPRLTRVGSFLRRTSLDELPQFINVLKGGMSVVGPRPHAVAHNEHYRKLIKSYMLRHKVKPGITGWAQINGLRGNTDTLDKMEKRVEHDLYYIENWSVFFDLKIMWRTLLGLSAHKNAY